MPSFGLPFSLAPLRPSYVHLTDPSRLRGRHIRDRYELAGESGVVFFETANRASEVGAFTVCVDQFEAINQLDPDEQAAIRALVEAALIRHQARKIAS